MTDTLIHLFKFIWRRCQVAILAKDVSQTNKTCTNTAFQET